MGSESNGVNDPLEPLNRFFYGINYVLDHTLLRPLAMAYSAAAPDPVQKGVRSFLRNLNSPIILVNNLLQGQWDEAWTTATRFVLNTTIGGLGFYDAAQDFGYRYRKNDFGQTLAHYGMNEGPYLVLPLLGPSNTRDTIGISVDSFLDPLGLYATVTKNKIGILIARNSLVALDTETQLLGILEDIDRTSIDTYSTLRSLYRQRRAATIRNKQAPEDTGIPGDEFDFDEIPSEHIQL